MADPFRHTPSELPSCGHRLPTILPAVHCILVLKCLRPFRICIADSLPFSRTAERINLSHTTISSTNRAALRQLDGAVWMSTGPRKAPPSRRYPCGGAFELSVLARYRSASSTFTSDCWRKLSSISSGPWSSTRRASSPLRELPACSGTSSDSWSPSNAFRDFRDNL